MSLIFSFSRLTLAKLLSYGKQLLFIVESEEIDGINTCTPYLNVKESDRNIQASYKAIRRSRLTDEVKAANKKRGTLIRQLVHMVKSFEHSVVPTEKSAAILIGGAIKQFGKDLPNQPLADESTNVNALLNEVAKRDYTASIELLRLAPVLEGLRLAQQEFESLYYQRKVKQTITVKIPSASKLRVGYEQNIRNMVAFAEANVTISKNAKWENVCGMIKNLNDTFDAQLRTRKVSENEDVSKPTNRVPSMVSEG